MCSCVQKKLQLDLLVKLVYLVIKKKTWGTVTGLSAHTDLFLYIILVNHFLNLYVHLTCTMHMYSFSVDLLYMYMFGVNLVGIVTLPNTRAHFWHNPDSCSISQYIAINTCTFKSTVGISSTWLVRTFCFCHNCDTTCTQHKFVRIYVYMYIVYNVHNIVHVRL